MPKELPQHQPPHMVRPLLPVAWHPRTRQFLGDIETISALYGVEINVLVRENRDGDLLVSASIPHDVSGEVHAFVSAVCARTNEIVPFLCAICGEVNSCAQRMHNGCSRWLCRQHMNLPLVCIKTEYLKPVQSPWLRSPAGAIDLMAVSRRAKNATQALAKRYNLPFVRQSIARADALRAQISIDETIKTKGKK